MPDSGMDHQSSSPSARFYAKRSILTPAEVDQDYQRAPKMPCPDSYYEEPFGHFQGFSSSANAHYYAHPQFEVYGCRMPDEMISPCTPNPNPVTCDSPRPRVQEDILNQYDNDAPELHQHALEQHASNTHVTYGSHGQSSRRWLAPHCYAAEAQQSSLSVYTDPAPAGLVYTAAPDHIAAVATHAEPSNPVTIRVPSCSPRSSLTSLPDASDFIIPEAGPVRYEAIPTPAVLERGGNRASTIHPDDSISIGAHSAASGRNTANSHHEMRWDFAEDVVAIHDICLAATQRYLKTLHVNWNLRNGEKVCPTTGRDRSHGCGQPDAKRRWSPYEPPARQRARSETDLRTLASNRNGVQAQDRHATLPRPEQNPIPLHTDSLLHNIHHICSIIWRRSQRDREDVLGAEVSACRDMSFLHESAETIVLYNTTDFENDPDGCFERVLEAGKGICRELSDFEGTRLLARNEVGDDDKWR